MASRKTIDERRKQNGKVLLTCWINQETLEKLDSTANKWDVPRSKIVRWLLERNVGWGQNT